MHKAWHPKMPVQQVQRTMPDPQLLHPQDVSHVPQALHRESGAGSVRVDGDVAAMDVMG